MQLTGLNETRRGLKWNLRTCGMKYLKQCTINNTSWPGIVHDPLKEYPFTNFQRHYQTINKVKTGLFNFFHCISGDKYIIVCLSLSTYIECIIHIHVVLK